ncbi:MAG: hypothetical protein H6502_02780 [Candidatus Woesearchaeota archaeon]|nr:MAG: hypothetical protein H6502_02780 [Candidatus Woesearchaeota archaeon]
MNKRFVVFVILSLFLLSSSLALFPQDSITLLTVAPDSDSGGTATLSLTVRPGNGAVFFDSTPLTEIDTQIATRFAQQFACSYYDYDCSKLDFFYVINADSSIVGGPSAGAATALLTLAVLADLPLKETAVITGTMTSGGIIGPVAGIKEKVRAAKAAGFSEVVIPGLANISSSLEFTDDGYVFVNMSDVFPSSFRNESEHVSSESSSSLPSISLVPSSFMVEGMLVHRMLTFDEVAEFFLSTSFVSPIESYELPERYVSLMKNISQGMCSRVDQIVAQVGEEVFSSSTDPMVNASRSFYFDAKNRTDDYYSIASLCYSASLKLRSFQLRNFSYDGRNRLAREVSASIDELEEKVLALPITTLSDVETYNIVSERILESREYVALFEETNNSDFLALGIERYNSGLVWSRFFLFDNGPAVDASKLRLACVEKIADADLRLNYLYTISRGLVPPESSQLTAAREEYSLEHYPLCIFHASQAKADADALLYSIMLSESGLREFFAIRTGVIDHLIAEQSAKGYFPILGYSYHEYAQVLETSDFASAFLFGEYALELSFLEEYFPFQRSREPPRFFSLDTHSLRYVFVSLFFLGFIVSQGLVFLLFKRRVKQSSPKGRSRSEK